MPCRTLSAITSGWLACRWRYRQIWPPLRREQTPVLVNSKQIGSLLLPVYGAGLESPLLITVIPELGPESTGTSACAAALAIADGGIHSSTSSSKI